MSHYSNRDLTSQEYGYSMQTLKISIIMLLFITMLPFEKVSAQVANDWFISTVWSKPKVNQYKYGEKFSFKIVPKLDSFVYVFYIDQSDGTIQVYPGKPQNNEIVTKENPLEIKRVLNEVMRVNGQKGKLITVAVVSARHSKQIKDSVLSEEDFDMLKLKVHPKLDIKGSQLLKRFRLLKTEYPNKFHYLVENAPRSEQNQN